MLQWYFYAFAMIVSLLTQSCQSTGPVAPLKTSGPHRLSLDNLPAGTYLDVHNHLFGGNRGGNNYRQAAAVAIEKMDQLGIGSIIVMPPPRSGNKVSFDMYDLLPAVSSHPNRFMIMGGGGTLNVFLHDTSPRDALSVNKKDRFRKKALDLLANGAIGFGEIAIEHFSFNNNHPYESVPADHPLLLLLADIAADNNVPIDIHMEAVPRNMPLPESRFLNKSKRNPATLNENISAFEKLLRHNQRAKIIWSHLGWCNTGYRTPDLCRNLLLQHPNLYMSFKLSRESMPQTRPISIDKSSIKPEWLQLIKDFPDRFLIGTDQFYVPPGAREIGPQKTEATQLLISLLPEQLRQKIGVENPARLFNLLPE